MTLIVSDNRIRVTGRPLGQGTMLTTTMDKYLKRKNTDPGLDPDRSPFRPNPDEEPTTSRDQKKPETLSLRQYLSLYLALMSF